MSLPKIAAPLLAAIALFAQPPQPSLRVEPTAGGSIFYVRNTSSQPLTAYLIELVGYPGSSYSFWQDDNAAALIAPGAEQRIPVANMTVGAVPEYVKVQAALYADGSSSGTPDKVTQLVERRRAILETTRELIRRLEKARSDRSEKSAVISALQQWSDSLEPQTKSRRITQQSINQTASRSLIVETIARLNRQSLDEALSQLRAAERSLAASKPPL